MERSNKNESGACEFCGQCLLFPEQLKVIAVGIEGTAITQLAACSLCQSSLEDDAIIEPARDILLTRYRHTSAVQIVIVKQPGKRKRSLQRCGR